MNINSAEITRTRIDVTQPITLAERIARRAAVSDIEVNGIPVRIDDIRYYDVRPMLDPERQPQEFIDMNDESIHYALAVDAAHRHPTFPYLLRISLA